MLPLNTGFLEASVAFMPGSLAQEAPAFPPSPDFSKPFSDVKEFFDVNQLFDVKTIDVTNSWRQKKVWRQSLLTSNFFDVQQNWRQTVVTSTFLTSKSFLTSKLFVFNDFFPGPLNLLLGTSDDSKWHPKGLQTFLGKSVFWPSSTFLVAIFWPSSWPQTCIKCV